MNRTHSDERTRAVAHEYASSAATRRANAPLKRTSLPADFARQLERRCARLESALRNLLPFQGVVPLTPTDRMEYLAAIHEARAALLDES